MLPVNFYKVMKSAVNCLSTLGRGTAPVLQKGSSYFTQEQGQKIVLIKCHDYNIICTAAMNFNQFVAANRLFLPILYPLNICYVHYMFMIIAGWLYESVCKILFGYNNC